MSSNILTQRNCSVSLRSFFNNSIFATLLANFTTIGFRFSLMEDDGQWICR